MEDLSEIHQEQIQLSDKDIFITIWTSPRTVFKYINDNRYEKFMYFLFVLSGITTSFNNAVSKHMGDKMPFWTIIIMCTVFGGLLGWIPYRIYASLIGWTGKWLNAQGDSNSILRMMSYALLPTIVPLLFLVFQMEIHGNEVFKSGYEIKIEGLGFSIFLFLNLALIIYTMVFFVIGTSEVQKLTIGRSILNLLLPLVVILLPLFMLGLIFKLLF